jgi:hypothetical protein
VFFSLKQKVVTSDTARERENHRVVSADLSASEGVGGATLEANGNAGGPLVDPSASDPVGRRHLSGNGVMIYKRSIC